MNNRTKRVIVRVLFEIRQKEDYIVLLVTVMIESNNNKEIIDEKTMHSHFK